jgi:hypothetical protein
VIGDGKSDLCLRLERLWEVDDVVLGGPDTTLAGRQRGREFGVPTLMKCHLLPVQRAHQLFQPGTSPSRDSSCP